MKNNHDSRLFIFVWYVLGVLLSISLFLYSYTQVDLNLTLSKASIWQTIQKAFQYVGYFQRPLSTYLYIGIIVGLFLFYALCLYGVYTRKIPKHHMVRLILLMSGILVFSYPAFSYDLFNHMFTAKSTLLYNKNPYTLIPMQLIGYDSWLNFMRWTHVPSIYSPLWIGMTLVPYLLGFGYFLFIMWNFKIMIGLFYLTAVYSIYKYSKGENPNDALLATAIFAFNPLVIIESLVSAHNDIVMMGFAMASFLVLRYQKSVFSFFLLALSISTKIMTIFLLPMYMFKNRYLPIVLMSIGLVVFLVIEKREMMSWYALWVLPFVSFFPKKIWLIVISAAWSFGLLLRYTPYLYQGNWDGNASIIKLWVTVVPVVVACLIVGLLKTTPFFKRK